MKHLATNSALIVLCTFILWACKKDDEDNNNNVGNSASKTQLLTSGNWKQTSDYINPAVDADGDGDKENELFDFFEPCSKDDLLIFAANGTVTFDEGASKCNSDDPQIIDQSTWKFIDNETKVVIGTGAYADTVQLTELSSTILKLNFSYKEDDINYTETLSYKH